MANTDNDESADNSPGISKSEVEEKLDQGLQNASSSEPVTTEESNKVDEKPTQHSEEEDTASNQDEWMDILGSGQLKKKVIKPGQKDSRPQRADLCEVRLQGTLENGTVVEKFDSLKIHIGDAEVIQGLDFSIPLMDVGEEAEVIVGPRFGYGTLGRDPDIPPGATLHYTVVLLSAEPEPEISTLSVTERKEIGNRKKERGNWWYARKENTLAIQCYRRALDYLDDIESSPNVPEDSGIDDSEIHNLLEDRIKVYNNLAAAQIKIKAFDTALQSIENVLRCQPSNVKALFRKGKVLGEKGEVDNSLIVLRQALSVDPTSEPIKKEIERLQSLRKKHSAQERNLYKKMFANNEKAKSQKPQGSTVSGMRINYFNNVFSWSLIGGCVAAVVLGALAFRYKYL